jgi:hypothetical protein
MASRSVGHHSVLQPPCAARGGRCTHPAPPESMGIGLPLRPNVLATPLPGNSLGVHLRLNQYLLVPLRTRVSPERAPVPCLQDGNIELFGWCAIPACRGGHHAAPETIGQCADGRCTIAYAHSVLTMGCVSNAEGKSSSWRALVPKSSASATGSKTSTTATDRSISMQFYGISLAAARGCPAVLRVSMPAPPP